MAIAQLCNIKKKDAIYFLYPAGLWHCQVSFFFDCKAHYWGRLGAAFNYLRLTKSRRGAFALAPNPYKRKSMARQ